MSKDSFENIKKKVTDFVEKNPRESMFIGAGVALVTGYLIYRVFWGSSTNAAKTGKPEDIVKDLETPGNPDAIGEETKERKPRGTIPSDSEDEPMLLRQAVNPKRDAEGIVDRETLIRIYDKRSTIRGMRKLDRQFKEKRRAVFHEALEYK